MPARIVVALLVSAFLFTGVRADSWELPQKKTYTSSNGRFEFRVVPKQIESQLKYFQDKAERKSDAGALAGVVDNVCRGTLFEKKDGKLVERWSIPLVNEVAPVSALVTNDGSYVVTFDNWHSVGYGDDVVVIYDSEGRLWRKYGLEEIIPESYLERMSMSTSSRHWGRDHTIDEENAILILQIANVSSPGTTVRTPTHSRGDDDGLGFSAMKISLSSGRVLEWRPRPWSVLEVASGRDVGAPDEVPGRPSLVQVDEKSCAAALTTAQSKMIRDVGSALADRATSSVNPPYPPMAKQANITGRVTVQVFISDRGEVLCSRAIEGHPLLRPASEAAVRRWKFEPCENGASPIGAVGTIVFDFRLVEVLPEGTVE